MGRDANEGMRGDGNGNTTATWAWVGGAQVDEGQGGKEEGGPPNPPLALTHPQPARETRRGLGGTVQQAQLVPPQLGGMEEGAAALAPPCAASVGGAPPRWWWWASRRGRTDGQPCPAAQATGRRGTMWMIWVYGQDGQGLHRGKARGGGESCTSTVSAHTGRLLGSVVRAPLHLTSPHASACWRGGWQAANGRLQLGWAGLGNVPTPRGPPGRPLEGDDGWPTGGLLVPSGCIDGARDVSRWCGLWAVDTSSEIALMTNSWGHLKRGWEAQAGPVWRWLALTGWAGCRVMSGYKLSPRWLGEEARAPREPQAFARSAACWQLPSGAKWAVADPWCQGLTCPPGVVTRPNQVPGKHSSRRSLCVVEDAAPLAQRARGSPAMIGRFRRRELRRELHDPGTRLARTQSRPLDRLLHDFFADCVCRETASFTVRQRRREFSIRPGGGEESGCFSLDSLHDCSLGRVRPILSQVGRPPRPVITASSPYPHPRRPYARPLAAVDGSEVAKPRCAASLEWCLALHRLASRCPVGLNPTEPPRAEAITRSGLRHQRISIPPTAASSQTSGPALGARAHWLVATVTGQQAREGGGFQADAHAASVPQHLTSIVGVAQHAGRSSVCKALPPAGASRPRMESPGHAASSCLDPARPSPAQLPAGFLAPSAVVISPSPARALTPGLARAWRQ
ncbi:hypothetical protein PCL_11443 [Purpureocillium lilacinum]|uniref:Uncharacterized protein n=1 Tax=Purpureocillium lilacinum TaxID=33203 RepID=A0A2U3EA28_PURLI|nr:hypothetical protein PCL_11443 [Purpureocillium lilacinum]